MLRLIRGGGLRGGGEEFVIFSDGFFNIHVIDIFTTYCHFTRRGTLGLRPFILLLSALAQKPISVYSCMYLYCLLNGVKSFINKILFTLNRHPCHDY